MKKKYLLGIITLSLSLAMITGCKRTQLAEVTEVTEAETSSDETSDSETENNSSETENVNVVGNYVNYHEEEMEGEILKYTNIISLFDDHTCEVTFQDTIKGEWDDKEIRLDDGSKFEFYVEGEMLNLNMDGAWITYERVDSLDAIGENVDEEAESVDAEADVIDEEADVIDEEADKIDAEADVIDEEADKIDAEEVETAK